VQVILTIILTIAVSLFEIDLHLLGGMAALTQGSRFENTIHLNNVTLIHTLLAIATAIIWLVLVPISLRKFPKPPVPNNFSRNHVRWGKIGMWGMILTGLTAIPLYVLGFAL
jgi:hypothetical protein